MPDYSSSKGNGPNAAATLPNHQLGEVLGRGAFGCVYRALNWQTGETVAVKQIELSNIPNNELPEIMSEIDLLKNLDHPNVVQYRGFVKTVDFLWIILEYCENGSLTAICKKFGKFPESLCQIYICQVLEGLLYLHDQGVIHRDVKGSNILATKEGSIKLADFGVATRVGGLDRSVVGSPYWMAPEVVEQSGATTASDIWSVGCVVIELLEGQPPYHELAPMPALFRIVNDDCPPLPDSASPVVRDFLLQCFQKDSNLRISARKLLKHPWMVSARRQLDQMKRKSNVLQSNAAITYDETVTRVKEWNKALDTKASIISHPLTAIRPSTSKLSQEVVNALMEHPKSPSRSATSGPRVHSSPRSDGAGAVSQDPAVKTASRRLAAIIIEDDKENDSWDNDFEGGILGSNGTPSALNGDADASRSEDELFDDDFENSLTIKPSAISPDVARASASLSKPIDFPCRQTAKSNRAMLLDGEPIAKPALFIHNPSTASDHAKVSTARIRRFSETDPEDYSDVFGEAPLVDPNGGQLTLNHKLSSRSWLADDDIEEVDPFAEVESGLDEDMSGDSLAASLHRDQVAKMCSFVNDLLDGMSAEADEVVIRDGCLYLIDILETHPEVKAHFIRMHGLFTIVESLQSLRFKEVIGLELHIINLILANDEDNLEKLCVSGDLRVCLVRWSVDTSSQLLGGCPVIMKFSQSRYPRDIRLEAALFIGAMCRTSLLTLQIFISCKGIKSLVNMMDEDYQAQRDLVWMAIDGICRVFEMEGATPRNDFCRMFAREGLLEPLSSALLAVANDHDGLAANALQKIVHILFLFAQSDLKVRQELAQRPIILQLVRSLKILPKEVLSTMLKTIKGITMVPVALEVLQHANAIEVLVKIMSEHTNLPEICNPSISALYNLCRLSKSRQEEAALAGAISVLIRLIHSNSPLKQFALPIICDFAQTSKTCRKLLWSNKVFDLYIHLLTDPYWYLAALESILFWMQDETSRVEDGLLRETSIVALLQMFANAASTSFENLLEPFLKILRMSPSLCTSISLQPPFFRRLEERLSKHTKAVVRLNLLRIVRTFLENRTCSSPVQLQIFSDKPSALLTTIERLASSDPSRLVKNLAKEIYREYRIAQKQTEMATAQPKIKRKVSPLSDASSTANLSPVMRGTDSVAQVSSPSVERSRSSNAIPVAGSAVTSNMLTHDRRTLLSNSGVSLTPTPSLPRTKVKSRPQSPALKSGTTPTSTSNAFRPSQFGTTSTLASDLNKRQPHKPAHLASGFESHSDIISPFAKATDPDGPPLQRKRSFRPKTSPPR